MLILTIITFQRIIIIIIMTMIFIADCCEDGPAAATSARAPARAGTAGPAGPARILLFCWVAILV